LKEVNLAKQKLAEEIDSLYGMVSSQSRQLVKMKRENEGLSQKVLDYEAKAEAQRRQREKLMANSPRRRAESQSPNADERKQSSAQESPEGSAKKESPPPTPTPI
jgi:cell division protein FtsB